LNASKFENQLAQNEFEFVEQFNMSSPTRPFIAPNRAKQNQRIHHHTPPSPPASPGSVRVVTAAPPLKSK
jgi:hypothetical protein